MIRDGLITGATLLSEGISKGG